MPSTSEDPPHTKINKCWFLSSRLCQVNDVETQGHLDQPNPLGGLLPSCCLFSPTTQLFSWAIFWEAREILLVLLFLSALLQFRQLWKRISRFPYGRRREWWDYFGLSLRRAAPTSMPGLGRATWGQTGGQLQEMAGHLGLVPGAISALLLDSRHSHKPDHLENYNKTCIDTRKKGLNTGDKGQKPSQASREASFYRAAAVPSLPLQLSYIDVPQRCWSPSH